MAFTGIDGYGEVSWIYIAKETSNLRGGSDGRCWNTWSTCACRQRWRRNCCSVNVSHIRITLVASMASGELFRYCHVCEHSQAPPLHPPKEMRWRRHVGLEKKFLTYRLKTTSGIVHWGELVEAQPLVRAEHQSSWRLNNESCTVTQEVENMSQGWDQRKERAKKELVNPLPVRESLRFTVNADAFHHGEN